MNPLETVASTDDPSFASDSDGRILAWNRGAERLLGHTASEVVGMRCYEVLEGIDPFGNRFCHERCAIRNMAGRHEPVHHCELRLRSAAGQRVRTSVSVFVLAGPSSDYTVVHLLEKVGNAAKGANPGTAVASGTKPAQPSTRPTPAEVSLTVRETEVLRTLATGASTAEIARRLSISAATVRNHVHSVLRKLDAHNRLQAVCIAIRKRLL